MSISSEGCALMCSRLGRTSRQLAGARQSLRHAEIDVCYNLRQRLSGCSLKKGIEQVLSTCYSAVYFDCLNQHSAAGGRTHLTSAVRPPVPGGPCCVCR